MMLTQIIKHEWRMISRDRTLLVVTLLLAGVVGYGVFNAASWVQFQRATIDRVVSDEAEKFTALKDQVVLIEQGRIQAEQFMDPRDPGSAGRNFGQRHAIMPPARLAALSIGQSDLYPYYFKMSTRSKQAFINSDEIENPNNLLAGRFDLAFVIVYLFPLLILALSYNLLSAEKESGTLAMVGAQPVRLRTLVLGKIIMRAGVVLGLAIGFSLIGVLLSGVDLTSNNNGDVALRLVLWVIVVAAYGALWFALAVAVNALNRSSATNAIALSGVWLVFVVIAPALVNLGATTLYPVPSRVELINAIRDASNEATAEGSRLLAKFYEDHPEMAAARDANFDASDFRPRFFATQEKIDRSIKPVLERFDRQLMRQQNLVDQVSFLSPAIITQQALNDIAGTSVWRYRHFLRLVDGYHAEWQSFFIPKVFQKIKLTAADYDRVPRFTWNEESTSSVARRVLIGLVGLILPTLLIGVLGLTLLRRYRVAG